MVQGFNVVDTHGHKVNDTVSLTFLIARSYSLALCLSRLEHHGIHISRFRLCVDLRSFELAKIGIIFMCAHILNNGMGDIEPLIKAICDSFKVKDNDGAYQKLKKVIEDELKQGNDSIPRLIRIGLNTIKEFI